MVLGLAYVILCWPWFIWHGYSSGGNGWGWRWDLHSTVACVIWWGVLLLLCGAEPLNKALEKRGI